MYSIKDGVLQSKTWWPPRVVPPKQAPNEPPKMFVGYGPSILLNVNGEPVLSEVP